MIDIEKVREAIENIKKIDIYVDGSFWNYKDTDYKNDVIVIEQALTELERLQKKETYLNQFKNSKYVVIQDSVAKGYEFDNIKEAVDKLYSLKANNEDDIGVLGCVGGDKVFMIAERKLDWSDEE